MFMRKVSASDMGGTTLTSDNRSHWRAAHAVAISRRTIEPIFRVCSWNSLTRVYELADKVPDDSPARKDSTSLKCSFLNSKRSVRKLSVD